MSRWFKRLFDVQFKAHVIECSPGKWLATVAEVPNLKAYGSSIEDATEEAASLTDDYVTCLLDEAEAAGGYVPPKEPPAMSDSAPNDTLENAHKQSEGEAQPLSQPTEASPLRQHVQSQPLGHDPDTKKEQLHERTHWMRQERNADGQESD